MYLMFQISHRKYFPSILKKNADGQAQLQKKNPNYWNSILMTAYDSDSN